MTYNDFYRWEAFLWPPNRDQLVAEAVREGLFTQDEANDFLKQNEDPNEFGPTGPLLD